MDTEGEAAGPPEFSPASEEARVKTRSPWLDAWEIGTSGPLTLACDMSAMTRTSFAASGTGGRAGVWNPAAALDGVLGNVNGPACAGVDAPAAPGAGAVLDVLSPGHGCPGRQTFT